MSQTEVNFVDLAQIAPQMTAESESEMVACLVSPFKMKDGMEVTLRPIRPTDEPLMARFHQTLSDYSVYMRYFYSLSLRSRVAHERLVRICFADCDREIALVVDREDRATGQHEILAVGRLITSFPKNEAEVAIVVSDRYQKQGLGTELLRRTIQIARDKKLGRVWGELLRDNLAMQTILRKLGFRFRLCLNSPSITAILEV